MAVTLRGAVGQSYTSNTNAITLPAGSAAGDWALLVAGNGWNLSSITGIIDWIKVGQWRSGSGQNIVYVKQLTSADITTGSVTITWSGSYGGHTSLAVAQSAGGIQVRSVDSDNTDGLKTTGRTLTVPVKNGMVGIYIGEKRKDTVTPAVSFNRGTLDNATAVANYAGAIAHEVYVADQNVTLTSTWDSAGQSEFIVAAVFADSFPAESDLSVEFAVGSATHTGLLYKGRSTAALDAANVP